MAKTLTKIEGEVPNKEGYYYACLKHDPFYKEGKSYLRIVRLVKHDQGLVCVYMGTYCTNLNLFRWFGEVNLAVEGDFDE